MNKALASAVRLLARREHSLAELANKLAQKGYDAADIQDALKICQHQGLQSDSRFAESFCRTRIYQGYGPVKIRQELQAKQVSREQIEEVLNLEQHNWFDHAFRVWHKKYHSCSEPSFSDKQKQKQFLLYRGFAMDTIAAVVK